MTRAETTKFLGELLVSTRLNGAGKYWASEVSIDPWTTKGKRVDYMQFLPENQMTVSGIEKGSFTCYEVKSCKEDVYSGNGLNFFGETNYIVTTMECYKDILPDFRSGKFARHLREQFPESSEKWGVMVAIPDYAEPEAEFENPTPLDGRPEMWKLYNSKIKKGESIRVFPISNWTETDIWKYIKREKIDIVPLYFAKERPVIERDGNIIMVDDDRLKLRPDEKIEYKSVRFRTLGCYPLTGGVESKASTLDEIIDETLSAVSSERTTRVIDNEAAGSMERRKREGYF